MILVVLSMYFFAFDHEKDIKVCWILDVIINACIIIEGVLNYNALNISYPAVARLKSFRDNEILIYIRN